MCGIAGWLDFGRDLTTERPVVQAMMDTQARRGPDGEGLFLQRHVALCHRRLAILDPSHGHQPMQVGGDGAPDLVIVYTGEVYNFVELRGELEALGHRFTTRTDTEVVLHAYQQWGEGALARLNGMYAFAVWDEGRQELTLVRDRLGVKPLYYYPTPSGLLFASEPKGILANPLARRAIDRQGLCEMLTMVKTPGQAGFVGMAELRPGHVLTASRSGLRVRPYWQLQAQPHTDDLPTTIGTVRALLDDIVGRHLVADVPLCALLSGGLDSSLVAALAQRHLRARQGRSLQTFSIDFVGSVDHFKSQDMYPDRDAPFAKEVSQHIGSQHHEIILSSADLADDAPREAVLAARDLPNFLGDMDSSLYLLFRAIRAQATVALSGESADEVFGGYFWFHTPALREAPTFPWLAMLYRAQQAGQMPPSLWSADLLQRLDLPGYIAQRYDEALREVPQLAGESAHERRMREVFYLHLTRWLQILLDRKDRTSMASGLEVRVPFCDHRLVEYLFNTPFALKAFDGREKSLLRAAAADLLPKSVLDRKKSQYPTTQDPAYGQAVAKALRAVLDDPEAPVRPLINRDLVRRVVDSNVVGGTVVSRVGPEQILAMNAWLRRHNVQIVD
ncbi:MAG TPA: asparagine synthase (glutamine-hydrolyzing) [Pseudomonadota bacterium]|nr:asparagine synthase (glutamine-hydrolyzing) [Pseudomonadota bacterium]